MPPKSHVTAPRSKKVVQPSAKTINHVRRPEPMHEMRDATLSWIKSTSVSSCFSGYLSDGSGSVHVHCFRDPVRQCRTLFVRDESVEGAVGENPVVGLAVRFEGLTEQPAFQEFMNAMPPGIIVTQLKTSTNYERLANWTFTIAVSPDTNQCYLVEQTRTPITTAQAAEKLGIAYSTPLIFHRLPGPVMPEPDAEDRSSVEEGPE